MSTVPLDTSTIMDDHNTIVQHFIDGCLKTFVDVVNLALKKLKDSQPNIKLVHTIHMEGMHAEVFDDEKKYRWIVDDTTGEKFVTCVSLQDIYTFPNFNTSIIYKSLCALCNKAHIYCTIEGDKLTFTKLHLV